MSDYLDSVIMGFLQICAGVILLQLSKSAKNVPDTEVFRGDLDQVRTVAEQEEDEFEPKAGKKSSLLQIEMALVADPYYLDAIRGAAAIIRRFSVVRQEKEAAEAHRILDERMRETQIQHLAAPMNEWDDPRRRIPSGRDSGGRPRRRNTTATAHPPLGLTRIPDVEENPGEEPGLLRNTSQRVGTRRRSVSLDAGMAPGGVYRGFSDTDLNPEELQTLWQRTKGIFVPKTRSERSIKSSHSNDISTPWHSPMPLTDIQRPVTSAHSRNSLGSGTPPPSRAQFPQPSPYYNHTIHRDWASNRSGSNVQILEPSSPGHRNRPPLMPSAIDCSSSVKSVKSTLMPDSKKQATRQFSFQSIFSRAHRRNESTESAHSTIWKGLGSRKVSRTPDEDGFAMIDSSSSSKKTQEEMMGLVKGDRVNVGEGALPRYVSAQSDSESDDEKAKEAGILLNTRKATDATTSDEADDEKSTGPESDSIYGGNSNDTSSTIRIVYQDGRR